MESDIIDLIIENQDYKDHKTRLQEYTQKHFKETTKYLILGTSGKDHDKTFECGVSISNLILGKGVGKSKQEAQTFAAKNAMTKILATESPLN
jgi:ribonuclease-3